MQYSVTLSLFIVWVAVISATEQNWRCLALLVTLSVDLDLTEVKKPFGFCNWEVLPLISAFISASASFKSLTSLPLKLMDHSSNFANAQNTSNDSYCWMTNPHWSVSPQNCCHHLPIFAQFCSTCGGLASYYLLCFS